MNSSSLRCVLRHARSLTGDLSGEGDAELLLQFKDSADEAAFAALVGRHGPMVWGVCRHLLPDDSDADDAFQATFFTFIRSTPNGCTSDSLAGWLHRVAYRVALKARRSAQRRRDRERAVAAADRANEVPDSAWDRLFAAVHEEVNRLPDSLRLPFVLCCLEGRRTGDAATALKVKLGTLSSRLTRAKQRVLDRLARRGLPVAVVAGSIALASATGSAAVPAILVEKTVALTGTASSIPSSILQLSLGVMEMNITRTKLIGAVLLASGLLVVGIGPAVVPWASAQSAPKARPDNTDAGPAQSRSPAAAKWEYAYVEAPQPMAQSTFEAACRKMEPEGWEYCGTQEMTLDRSSGAAKRGPGSVLVFKRPAKSQTVTTGAKFTAWQTESQSARIVALEQELARLLAAERARRDRGQDPSINPDHRGAIEPRYRDYKSDTAKREPPVDSSSNKSEAAKQGPPVDSAGQNLRKNKPHAESVVGTDTGRADPGWGATPTVPIEILALDEASADTMAKLLAQMFGQRGTFYADDRSNSLVIKADAKTLSEVKALIERLEKQAMMRRERDKVRDRVKRQN